MGLHEKYVIQTIFENTKTNRFELTFEIFQKLRNSCMIEIKNEPNATVPKWNFTIFLKLITIGDWISSLFLDLMKRMNDLMRCNIRSRMSKRVAVIESLTVKSTKLTQHRQ